MYIVSNTVDEETRKKNKVGFDQTSSHELVGYGRELWI